LPFNSCYTEPVSAGVNVTLGEFVMNRPKQKAQRLLASCIVLTMVPGGLAYQSDQSTSPATVQAAKQAPEQLQQLVAPIALYPDALVAQIVAAATYPDEIAQAEQWLQQHAGLEGEPLAQAVDQQPWDPSVKALTEFPSVLANMDKNISWTSSLGDAYVNQQPDVMNAVQVMRSRAEKAGNLQTTAQEKVSHKGKAIVIEPADSEIVYLPQYDPWLVYGSPVVAWPGWYGYPGLYVGGPGMAFGLGVGIGLFGGFGWGWHHWGSDWGHHEALFDHQRFESHSRAFADRRGLDGRGRGGVGHFSGPHGGDSHGGSAFHGGSHPAAPHFQPGPRSGAFGGFNHGGVTRGFSSRGRSSFGGGFHGGGGGFHGGGGGHGGGGRR
jgi:hypothetical protein